MVGWHHRLSGHEIEQTHGDGEGQGSLTCRSPWDHKEPDVTEPLNKSKAINGKAAITEYHITIDRHWGSTVEPSFPAHVCHIPDQQCPVSPLKRALTLYFGSWHQLWLHWYMSQYHWPPSSETRKSPEDQLPLPQLQLFDRSASCLLPFKWDARDFAPGKGWGRRLHSLHFRRNHTFKQEPWRPLVLCTQHQRKVTAESENLRVMFGSTSVSSF